MDSQVCRETEGVNVREMSTGRRVLIVVAYHYVRPRFDFPCPGIHGITPSILDAQLRLLGGRGQFVSVEMVRAAVGGGAPLPDHALLITFDDGLREQVDYALPVLDRLGIPAVFFVNTEPIATRTLSTVHKIHMLRAQTPLAALSALLRTEVPRQGLDPAFASEPAAAAAAYPWDPSDAAQLKYFLNHQLAPDARDALVAPCFRRVFGDEEAVISHDFYMDVDQLRALSARGYLGTHGDRHLSLGRLSRAAVQDNVGTSMDRLAAWTGARPFALSYPFGTFESSTVEAGAGAAAAGVEVAFTMERAANLDLDRPLHLARFDCNDLPGGPRPCFAVESLFESVPAARWHR